MLHLHRHRSITEEPRWRPEARFTCAELPPGHRPWLLDDGSRASLQVNVEDRVLFSSYAGTEIKVDGEDLLLVREEEILAIIQ